MPKKFVADSTEDNRETIVVDAETMALFTRQQLTRALVKNSLRAFPKLKIASGDIMPVVIISGYEWENEITVQEFSVYGMAQVLAGAANDGGRVGVTTRAMSYPIRTISAYTLVSYIAIKQAMVKNIGLDAKYAEALRIGIDKKINDVGYNGDPDYGLQGLFTSNIPRENSPNTLASLSSTPDALINLLASFVSLCVSNNHGVWLPKIIVMPLAQQQLISTVLRTNAAAGVTVLAAFLEAQEALGQIERIVVDDTLKGKGVNGTDAMLVLPFDTDPNGEPTGDDEETRYPIFFALALEMNIPGEFEQWIDTNYRERAIARIGGTVVTEPQTALIISGI